VGRGRDTDVISLTVGGVPHASVSCWYSQVISGRLLPSQRRAHVNTHILQKVPIIALVHAITARGRGGGRMISWLAVMIVDGVIRCSVPRHWLSGLAGSGTIRAHDGAVTPIKAGAPFRTSPARRPSLRLDARRCFNVGYGPRVRIV